MDERVAKSTGTARNEEYRKLNTDFLLLSALIKDHKAKKTQHHQPSSVGRISALPKASSHQASHSKPVHLATQSSLKYVRDVKEVRRKWVGKKNPQLLKNHLQKVSEELPQTKGRPALDSRKTRNIYSSLSNIKTPQHVSPKLSDVHVPGDYLKLKEQHLHDKRVTSRTNLEAKLQATKDAVIANRKKIEWLTKQAEKVEGVKRNLSRVKPQATSTGKNFGGTSFSSGIREGLLPFEGASLQLNSSKTKVKNGREANLPIANNVSCPNTQKSNCSLNRNELGDEKHGRRDDVDVAISRHNAPCTRASLQQLETPSVKLSSIRTAHKESLKNLENAARSLSSPSADIEDKICEIARVEALSVYLTKLKEKNFSKRDDTNAESSRILREHVKGETPVEGEQSTLRLPQGQSKYSQVSSHKVTPNHHGNGEASHALPSGQQTRRKYSANKTVGKVKALRCLPHQNLGKDSTESDEIRKLKTDIAILNAKIKLKHFENKRKGDGRKKSKYVWTPHSQSLSGTGPLDRAKKTKVSQKKTPRAVSRSVNRFFKINPSEKSKSLKSGNRSLVKTRTRYKVRKSYPKSTSKKVKGTRQEHSRLLNDTRIYGGKTRPGGNSSKSLKRTEKQYPANTTSQNRFQTPGRSRFRQQKSRKQYHHGNRSLFNKKHNFHGQHYIPLHKMQWSMGRQHLWDRHEKPSFVTRRLKHMVEHSPMLFRSNPFLGRNRSCRKLDQIWHSPKFMANGIHYQVKRTPLRMKATPSKQPSANSGGTASKKVMNVVKINGVRYSRHGKSLKRLPVNSAEKVKKAVSPITSRKVTNTKIVAHQVLQRSIFLSRTAKLRKAKKQEYCMFFNRFGRCYKGSSCPYKHDPDKVAICTRFLRGMCNKATGVCPFSHKVSKDRMPVCRFFLKGICTQVDCPYSHVKVNNSASICRDFVQGYCAKGEKCTKKHLLECAEYSQKGSCPRKRCPLWHKKKRKLPGQGQQRGRNSSAHSRALEGERELSTSPSSSFIQLREEETSCADLESDLKNKITQPLQIRPVFQTVIDP